ncbi:MAG: (d)CMP kinase [Puniceicoccaceae bacterium]
MNPGAEHEENQPDALPPVVTVDGGAATGKSSTARGVAARLNLLHVDTGSHYRALTLLLLRQGIAPRESHALDRALRALSLSSGVAGTEAYLLADGERPSAAELRGEDVNRSVSAFAALAPVRLRLLRYQRWHRTLAAERGLRGLIMEGRDIGSVVFPEAEFRFFLEADADTRVRRRLEEGQTDSVVERDQADTGRKAAPLLCPPGAIRIDTARHTLGEVIDLICDRVDPGAAG